PIIYPPPAFGGPVLKGLPNTIFAHEGRYSGREASWVVDFVIQSLRTGASYLEEQEKAERRRRKSLFYWPDRFLTAVLGFPVYLLSRIVGVSQERIEESPIPGALRMPGLVL